MAFVGCRRNVWVVTVLATAASTYALDAFAVAVGALLAASGVLAGLDRPLLLTFLAATYVVWAAGLRVNLAANWSLLTCTGASTNAFSKAAHDIARARNAGSRTRRFAASGGYILTEAAKEVPYYASAFGAVLVSDAVSSDAIISLAQGLLSVRLGGCNLGLNRGQDEAVAEHRRDLAVERERQLVGVDRLAPPRGQAAIGDLGGAERRGGRSAAAARGASRPACRSSRRPARRACPARLSRRSRGSAPAPSTSPGCAPQRP
jgi:hypothetical protein